MEPLISAEVMRKLGFAGSILTAAIVVGVGFYIYRSILQTELTKLQIESLKRAKQKDTTPASA